MTNSLHQVRFPGENEQYRSARNELLEAELELRQTLEAVASLRRKLPPGGKIKEDYLFEEISSGSGSEMIKQTKLSGLFVPGKDSLISLIHFLTKCGGHITSTLGFSFNNKAEAMPIKVFPLHISAVI